MLIIVVMCASLMKSLRAEPYESTLAPRVRRAVLHAQEHDLIEHQSVVLATLGHDAAEAALADLADELDELADQDGDAVNASPVPR